jgi:hypothetical protein
VVRWAVGVEGGICTIWLWLGARFGGQDGFEVLLEASGFVEPPVGLQRVSRGIYCHTTLL